MIRADANLVILSIFFRRMTISRNFIPQMGKSG